MHGVDRVPLWAVPASQPAEALFEFIVDGDCWRFQLIESGSVLGVAMLILVNGKHVALRWFVPLDSPRPRQLAIAWAVEERKAIENP